MLNNGQYIWRVTGTDINNYKRTQPAKGEVAFYSIIFIIGIMALGVVWG